MIFRHNNSYYLPTDKPVSLFAGALKGSNATMIWNFTPANISVSIENINGSFKVQIYDGLYNDQFFNFFEK